MIEAQATIRRWGLELADQIGFEAAIRKEFRAGAVVMLYVEAVRATRSLAANRWYWGVLIKALTDHTGYTAEEMHAILKAKFLPKNLAVRNRNGALVGDYVIGGTTTTLTPGEFHIYCRKARQWALEELDVAVPDCAAA